MLGLSAANLISHVTRR